MKVNVKSSYRLTLSESEMYVLRDALYIARKMFGEGSATWAQNTAYRDAVQDIIKDLPQRETHGSPWDEYFGVGKWLA